MLDPVSTREASGRACTHFQKVGLNRIDAADTATRVSEAPDCSFHTTDHRVTAD